jgi:zinc protease
VRFRLPPRPRRPRAGAPPRPAPRRSWAPRALAALLALAPAVAAAQSRADLEKVLKRRTLANGLEVVVIENHGVPLATVEIDVKNGAFTQTPDYAGLAHMYEHMFFKASQQFPAPDAFTNRASELGAVFNASTEHERVNYYMTLPADSLAPAMRAMASALRAPLFRGDELAREKEVVLGEYDRNQASPSFEFQNALTRLLYPGQFSRKNVIGDREVLRRVTPDQMREIQRRYYVPNNTALVVTGDVAPDSVFAWAQRWYGDWPRAEDPFRAAPIPAIPPLARDTAVVSEAPVSAVTAFVQWQGPSVRRDKAATYAADVLSDALNTPGSRFQRRLVDSGLWQTLNVNYITLDQVGPITVAGQAAPGRLREALAALHDEVEALARPGYFTTGELANVKAQRAMESALGAERASGLAHTIGFWWAVADVDYFLGYNDEMARQTPEDLRRYATAYISGRPRVTGVLLSAADRRALNLTEAELSGMWQRVAAAQAARAAQQQQAPAAAAPARGAAARSGGRRP